MADAAISAVVSDVLGRLTSAAIQEYGLLRELKSDLSALKKTFQKIQAVLSDAEKKQTTQEAVKVWLKTLRSASLEAENVLDEAKTEAMIQRAHREMGKKYKIRAFFTSRYNPLIVKIRIAHKVKNVRKKLKDIDASKSEFQLTPTDIREDAAAIGSEISKRETSSLVNLSWIYGRDDEAKMIVDKICNQDLGIRHDVDDVRVYAIWGMGGIGKTTLAQYVYNHETVKAHFEIKCWVYVSAVFDVKGITKQTIKTIHGPEKPLNLDDMSLDVLQIQLQNKLKGKKYFIMMDDVWVKDKEEWDKLCKALICGAKGSTIIVTTRDKDVAQLLAKIPELQHNVAVLSEDDSWSLFKMLAFPGGGDGENIRELKVVGREIAKKCKGLPLAVKIMGSLMSQKNKVNEWQLVNDEFMSEMQDNGILPSLRLSYNDLLPQLKRCFAYCCIFSKGEEMCKDLLIELWMANGFIDTYVLGEKILSCLVKRLFFQDVVEEGFGYRGENFKMHDRMHDLAKYEMGNDCAVIGPHRESITPDEVLHLSLSCYDYEFSKQDLEKLKSVRSMLVFHWHHTSNISQISNLVYLRVLYLNRIKSSTSLESICKLIHLRYLKISESEIEVLPKSIINLRNLQTLIISSCYKLRELPNGLKYMKNLQHLDTRYTRLTHMPVGITKLTNLRRLPNFVVGKDDGARIGELGNLNLLGWQLRLSKLENVRDRSDAKSANLKVKTNLKSLVLEWSLFQEKYDHEVLEGLEPSLGLQELSINTFKGRFISPSWWINLDHLTSIQIKNTFKCEQLPPLGKLRRLRSIYLHAVTSIKCFHEDDNATSSNEILFPNLLELGLSNLGSLVSLPSNFPKLRSLYIYYCHQLCSLPDKIQSFKDLNKITIEHCEILRRRCEKGIGEDWPKISHVPHLDIISPRREDEVNEENEDKDHYKKRWVFTHIFDDIFTLKSVYKNKVHI